MPDPANPEADAVRVVLSLGSNLGDRMAHLRAGLRGVADLVRISAVSSVYETDPVGGPAGQGPFLNAVVVGDTQATPTELLRRCHEVEAASERVRRERWGPRTLDVDIVSMGTLVRESPDPVLPHPRAAERAFVLLPWVEIDPDAELPGRGRISDLVDRLDTSGVHSTHESLEVAQR